VQNSFIGEGPLARRADLNGNRIFDRVIGTKLASIFPHRPPEPCCCCGINYLSARHNERSARGKIRNWLLAHWQIIAALGRKCKSVFGIWLGSLSLWFCSGCLLKYKLPLLRSAAAAPMLLLPLTTTHIIEENQPHRVNYMFPVFRLQSLKDLSRSLYISTITINSLLIMFPNETFLRYWI
jgi:hypothetical protein